MNPEIAILVSTYQRPRHLERVLASISRQERVAGLMEVVVTDDGSQDETLQVVNQFARRCDFPLSFTTHQHDGFRLAHCRNDGVRASTAPYLLFLDGDCLIPPDHVWQHLQRRRERVVQSGFCYRLDSFSSARIDLGCVMRGDYLRMPSRSEIRKLRILAWKSQFYSLIRHPLKPRLFGGNVGIWRSDYERINGYDENFVGWGGEDDDLRLRLRRAGVGVRSILPWTRTYHIWHPPVESAPDSIMQGANIPYLHRRTRLTRCLNGLERLSLNDLRVSISGDAKRLHETLRQAVAGDTMLANLARADAMADIEVAFAGAAFRHASDLKVLVLPEDASPDPGALHSADVVVVDQPLRFGLDPASTVRLSQVDDVLRRVA